jgi:orotidine-5'-phosphate decarboxylase
MGKKENKIVIDLDDEIKGGLKLIESINRDKELRKMVYGIKVGSSWVLEAGIDIVIDVHSRMWNDCNLILDMQKWPVDTPETVAKQVDIVAATGAVEELIACPIGGGRKSLESFVYKCRDGGIRPLCVLEMTHPESDRYLKPKSWMEILSDALSFDIDGFIVPATREPREEIKICIQDNFPNLLYDFYATEFRTKGGLTEPMRKFGVSKYIMGRAIYEAKDIGQTIRNAYEEINLT